MHQVTPFQDHKSTKILPFQDPHYKTILQRQLQINDPPQQDPNSLNKATSLPYNTQTHHAAALQPITLQTATPHQQVTFLSHSVNPF